MNDLRCTTEAGGFVHAARRTFCSYEFLGPLLLIGLPYGLAVLVQDALVPWVARTSEVDLGIVAFGGLSLGLVGIVLRVRRSLARAVHRADDLARSLATAERDLLTTMRTLDRDVRGPVRQLATVSTWLRREEPGTLDETARRHLDVLDARAARVRDVVESLIGNTPVSKSNVRPLRARRAQRPLARRSSPLTPIILRRA